jgi:hypothetical protein
VTRCISCPLSPVLACRGIDLGGDLAPRMRLVDTPRHAHGTAHRQCLEPRMNPYDRAYVPVMALMQDLQREAAAARPAASAPDVATDPLHSAPPAFHPDPTRPATAPQRGRRRRRPDPSPQARLRDAQAWDLLGDRLLSPTRQPSRPAAGLRRLGFRYPGLRAEAIITSEQLSGEGDQAPASPLMAGVSVSRQLGLPWRCCVTALTVLMVG